VTAPHSNPISRAARKASVGAAGVTTIAVGIALLPLPGPGTLIILGGLTMLGQEFPGAGRLADRGWKSVGRVTGFFRKQS
jgi:hypothetical protein